MKDDELIYLGILIIVFFICVLITRAIFSIPKLLKYNKAQTLLLVKIARQQGVTESEIELVINIVEPKSNPNSIFNESLTMQQIDNKR